MSRSLPSPSTDTALTQSEDGFNRIVGEHLDRLLLRYASAGERFTICELRDQLLREPELEQASPERVRVCVRNRINSLKNQGLASQVGRQGSRRPIFILDLRLTTPPSHKDDTPSSMAGDADQADGVLRPEDSPEAPAATPPGNEATPLAEFLDRERHRLKLDMQVALGEAAHYTYILKRYPDCRAVIEPLHQAACQRGSEVKGALDAVVKLRQSLGKGDDA